MTLQEELFNLISSLESFKKSIQYKLNMNENKQFNEELRKWKELPILAPDIKDKLPQRRYYEVTYQLGSLMGNAHFVAEHGWPSKKGVFEYVCSKIQKDKKLAIPTPTFNYADFVVINLRVLDEVEYFCWIE